jgi:hypothetical protein
MRPDVRHAWMSESGEHFADDEDLARHLAARIDAGDERVMFAREGCMFRLTWEDWPAPATVTPPVDAFWRSRTYVVTLLTNSSTCTVGDVFTSTWPTGYWHEPVQVVAKDAPSDAPVIVDGTMHDLSRVLTSIGIVLWPERYDL